MVRRRTVFTEVVHQIWHGFWLAVWMGLLGYVGWWVCRWGAMLMNEHHLWLGLAVAAVGLVVISVALRGLWVVVLILAGRVSPRMARREMRNRTADLLMYLRAGVWKE